MVHRTLHSNTLLGSLSGGVIVQQGYRQALKKQVWRGKTTFDTCVVPVLLFGTGTDSQLDHLEAFRGEINMRIHTLEASQRWPRTASSSQQT